AADDQKLCRLAEQQNFAALHQVSAHDRADHDQRADDQQHVLNTLCSREANQGISAGGAPSEQRSQALTISGSNRDPDQHTSSLLTGSIVSANAMHNDDRASKTSATCSTLAPTGMFNPIRPFGCPEPSKYSRDATTSSAAGCRNGVPLVIVCTAFTWSPRRRSMVPSSAFVVVIAGSGIARRPMSCSHAARSSSSSSRWLIPSSSPILSECSATRCACARPSESRRY